jgi:hypothetical protein
VVFAAGVFAPGFDVAAAQTVGMVTKVQNQAQVGGQAVAVGSPVHLNDTLQTGANARLQVTFRDNTNLTLGENATVVIDRFVFDPDAGVGEACAQRNQAGAFRMVTGRISDMPNKNITVKTSSGGGGRGTDFGRDPSGANRCAVAHNSRLDVRGDRCPEDADRDDRRCRCAVTSIGRGRHYIDRRTAALASTTVDAVEINSALSTTGFCSICAVAVLPAALVCRRLGVLRSRR